MSYPPVRVVCMTVLDLDPPHHALRLVSSTGSAESRDLRYRTSTPLQGKARELYREVLQAALASQRSVDADALRVVLATKQATSGAPIRAFSSAAIWQLMFVDVVAWCGNRRLQVPTRCATALIRVIEHLDTTNTFDDLSDPVDDLYDAIDECTGGWVDDHPATPTKAPRSLRSTRGSKRT